VDWLPEVALVPDQLPDAAQAVVSVDDQVRVEEAPFAIDGGFASSETVGIGASAASVGELSVSSTPPQAERPSAANARRVIFNTSTTLAISNPR